MFRWEKLGKIFSPSDLDGTQWMHEFAQSPSALIFDNYVRVYFCSRPKPDSNGQYLSYVTYLDLDRKNLLKVIRHAIGPVLSLGKTGCFDEFGTYPVSVIQVGNDIRAYYAGFTRCESVPFNAALGLAVSRDGGISFQRLGDGPILSYSPDEPFLHGSPRVRNFNGSYQLWYVAGREWREIEGKAEPIYKIRMATSDDGINWNKVGLDLIPDKLGEHECQACPDVIFQDGCYHMFFSYRDISNYKSNVGGYRIGYASSNDMMNWQRNDATSEISLSENGWDSEMINYPHVFELDGSTYMLYQGNAMGRDGFGIAKLKRERA
jgi:sucrose-6-phosphate hydrolase SacC (GH32 family)